MIRWIAIAMLLATNASAQTAEPPKVCGLDGTMQIGVQPDVVALNLQAFDGRGKRIGGLLNAVWPGGYVYIWACTRKECSAQPLTLFYAPEEREETAE